MITPNFTVLVLPPPGPLMQLHPRLTEIEQFLRRGVPCALADGTRVWKLDSINGLLANANELDAPISKFIVPAGPRGATLVPRLNAVFGDDIAVESDPVAALWMVESWLMRVGTHAGPGEAVVAAPGAPNPDRAKAGPGVALLPLESGPRLIASIAGALEVVAANRDARLVPFFRLPDTCDSPTGRAAAWWGLLPAGPYGGREQAATHSLMRRLFDEADYERFVAFERRALRGGDPWPTVAVRGRRG